MQTHRFPARSRGWGTSLLCAGTLMLAGLALCHLTFETNDDTGIIAIASGAFLGFPYAGNGYTSYLYGALLRALYTLSPGAPWHTLLMLAAVYGSLAAILKSVLALCAKNAVRAGYGLCAFGALFAGVLIPYVVKLQYTATAAFAGSAGICLLLLPAGGRSRADRRFSGVLAAGLLLAAFCLRADSFWAAMPLLVGGCALKGLSRRSLRPLLPCVLTLLAGAALGALDLALYRQNEPGWDSFRILYDLRRQFLDYNNTDLMEQAAKEALNWPRATIRVLRNWYMLDEHMSAESLTALLAEINARKPAPTLGSLIRATASILRRYPMFGLNFLAFGLWGLVSAVRYRRRRSVTGVLAVLGTAAYLIGFIAYFYGVLGRLPERAAFAAACPAYAFLTLACLPAWGGRPAGAFGDGAADADGNAAGRRGLALCVGLALLAGLATLGLYGEAKLPLRWRSPAQARRQDLSQAARDYALANPSQLFVTDITQWYAPLYTGPAAAVNLVEWGHVMQGAAVARTRLTLNGFSALGTEELTDPRVRLLITEGSESILRAYLEETCPGIVWHSVAQGDGFAVYRLER